MERIKLKHKKDNLLLYDGFIEYYKEFSKSVDVDGEIYTKTKRELVYEDISDLRIRYKDFFYKNEFNFELLDYSIFIEDCSYMTSELSLIASSHFGSSNASVSAICQAYEAGLLDDRILNVSYSKTNYVKYYPRDYKHSFKSILDCMEIDIILFNYGFNNSVYYTISLEDLFNSDPNKIPENIKNMFIKNGIDLESKNKLKQVGSLLIKKANI